MIYLLRFPAVGGETGKASTRKVLALRLSPPRDNLSRSRFIELGAPRSFSCPVIRQLYSAWRSHITESGGPEGQAASLSSGGSWPWVGQSHLRRWCWSLFPVEEVTAHPPLGSPHYARGRPLFHYGERKPPLIYHQKKGGKWRC